jgi:hypothetical protein
LNKKRSPLKQIKLEDIKIGTRVITNLNGSFPEMEPNFTGCIYHIDKIYDRKSLYSRRFLFILSILRDDKKRGSGENGTWRIEISNKTIKYLYYKNQPNDWDN